MIKINESQAFEAVGKLVFGLIILAIGLGLPASMKAKSESRLRRKDGIEVYAEPNSTAKLIGIIAIIIIAIYVLGSVGVNR